MRLSARPLAIVATLLLALLALPLKAAEAFPLTIEHAQGSTTIPAAPQRIVAMIDRDADTLLALGVVPVGIHSLFGFEQGVGPWSEALLGTATPAVWGGREYNYEAIAALKPDLIVFANSGGDKDVYDRLSAIAPTIGLPKGAIGWEATVQQTTQVIADALGRRDDGVALLAKLDDYLAATKAAHPEFAGKTANYLDIYPGGISSYSARHIVNTMLYGAGFSPIAAAELPEGQSSVQVSAELLPDYDADIVVIYPFGRTLADLEAETPTLGALASVKDGRAFVLDNLAFSNASVLSIPYALERVVPEFSKALAD